MSRLDKTQTGIILKFFDAEFKESLKRGEIYFSELSSFRSNSEMLTTAQADSQEAKHTTLLDDEKEQLFVKNPRTGDTVKIHFEKASINLELPTADVANMFISSFVFLKYDTDFDRVDDVLYIKKSVIEGLSDIANQRPFDIFYLDELIDSVKSQFTNQEYSVYCDLVEYRGHNEFIKHDIGAEPIRLAFTKQEKYANQKEYRVLIYNPNGLRPENLILSKVAGSNGQDIFEFECLNKLTFHE